MRVSMSAQNANTQSMFNLGAAATAATNGPMTNTFHWLKQRREAGVKNINHAYDDRDKPPPLIPTYVPGHSGEAAPSLTQPGMHCHIPTTWNA